MCLCMQLVCEGPSSKQTQPHACKGAWLRPCKVGLNFKWIRHPVVWWREDSSDTSLLPPKIKVDIFAEFKRTVQWQENAIKPNLRKLEILHIIGAPAHPVFCYPAFSTLFSANVSFDALEHSCILKTSNYHLRLIVSLRVDRGLQKKNKFCKMNLHLVIMRVVGQKTTHE